MVELATPLAIEAAKRLMNYFESISKGILAQKEETVCERIAHHLRFVERWADQLETFSTGRTVYTEEFSVSLQSSLPRLYHIPGESHKTFDENEIITASENILLTGAPGSGKTTTLKRVARLILHSEPIDANDHFNFPILLRLRDLNYGGDIIREISAVVGIEYQERHHKDTSGGEHIDFWVGNIPLEQALVGYLNSEKPLILLDGLDEVNPAFRSKVDKNIYDLSFHADGFKLIVSCRSGDITRQLGHFFTLEVNPLTKSEIRMIAAKWLDDCDEFISKAEETTYYDMLNRPLFLVQIIFIYAENMTLPERPSDVCRRVLLLCIARWDRERGVRRGSKYAHFDSEGKIDFLQHMAYDLLYRQTSKSFTTYDLVDTYSRIHETFGLPKGEGEAVVQEVESHSGIIVRVGFDKYEFCHLSLQEYLAANYIVREPLMWSVARYVSVYQAPIAIAVAISSNPSAWFASLILGSRGFGGIGNIQELNIRALIERLNIERPRFGVDPVLGFAALLACEIVNYNEWIVSFLCLPGVVKSIVLFIQSNAVCISVPGVRPERNDCWKFRWLGGALGNVPVDTTATVNVERQLLDWVAESEPFIVRVVDESDIESYVNFPDESGRIDRSAQ